MSKCLTLLSILVFFCAANASAITFIDNFEGPQFELLHTPEVPQTRTDSGVPNVIGGIRSVSYTNHAPILGDYGNSFGIWNSYLLFSCGSSAYGEFSLTYDNNGAGLGGVDLSSADNIIARMWTDHFGHLKSTLMSFSLTDMYGNEFTKSYSWSSYTLFLAYTDFAFPLADFTGIDTSQIDKILFYYEGDEGNDSTFAYIIADTNTKIPEPATLALFGFSLLGAGLFRKKSRR